MKRPPETTQPPELVAKNITKSFGSFQALHDVDITIFPGRVTAFVGPNGAGKTTMFHILTGNLRADRGQVLLDGQIITQLQPWQIARMGVGKLYQDVRIFENLTVFDNVRAALLSPEDYSLFSACRFWKHSVQARRFHDEAMSWLEYVGLADSAEKKGGELSFGQQKLLAIARLLAHKSRLLLLDEPTAALSPVMTGKMIALIKRMIEDRKVSIALIEHNMRAVRALAFYIYFMYEGTVFCHGTQKCVLENPEVRELYMGLSGETI